MATQDEIMQRYLEMLTTQQTSQASNINSLQEREKTFSDRLREKRAWAESASGRFQKDATATLDTNNPVPVNPREVMGAFNSFQNAVMDKVAPVEADYDKAVSELSTARTESDRTQLSGLEQLMKLMQEDRGLDIQQQNANTNAGSKTGGFAVIDPDTGKEVVVDDAWTATIMQGGKSILDNQPVTAGKAIAEAIQQMGGVENYLKQAPTSSLFNEKEIAARDAAANLMRISGSVVGNMPVGENADGVGWLGQFNLFPGDKGRRLRADMGELTAEKMRAISGAAISEQEAARLQQFLPAKGQRENTSRDNAKRLYNGLAIGLEMSELAKRNLMTLDEAYVAFADEVYGKYEEEVPGWIAEQRQSGGAGTDTSDEDLINKYKGK